MPRVFINFIEIPYFSLFAVLNPKLKFFYDNLINNKNILLSMQEKEKEKKKYKDEWENCYLLIISMCDFICLIKIFF